MHAFREAVEAGDIDAATGLLAEDVVFTSPVAFHPYDGKPLTAAILRAVLRVFQGFRYERSIGDPDGRDHALVFSATVDGKQIQGCDFLHLNEEGRIDEFTVMVRPLSAAQALSAAMAAQFDRIQQEAAAEQR